MCGGGGYGLAPVALLGAMLARLPSLCAAHETVDAMRVTHLLLRLAVERGAGGARAAAIGLAGVVKEFSKNSKEASGVGSRAELKTLHAQLRTLARLCAPPCVSHQAQAAAVEAIAAAPPLPPPPPRRLSLPSSRVVADASEGVLRTRASETGELVSTSTSIALPASIDGDIGLLDTTETEDADAAASTRADAALAEARETLGLLSARRLGALGDLATSIGDADERARRITTSLVEDLDLALANEERGTTLNDDDGAPAAAARHVAGALDELVDREFEQVARAAAAAARGGIAGRSLAAAVGLDLDDDDDSDMDDTEASDFAAAVARQHRAAAAAASSGRARLNRSGLGSNFAISNSVHARVRGPTRVHVRVVR